MTLTEQIIYKFYYINFELFNLKKEKCIKHISIKQKNKNISIKMYIYISNYITSQKQKNKKKQKKTIHYAAIIIVHAMQQAEE